MSIKSYITGLFKRSLDKSRAAWLGLLGPTTSSGQTVNEITALNLLPVFASVRAISETLLQTPMFVMETVTDSSGRESTVKARTHPVFALLHDMANPILSAGNFRQTIMGHVLTYGNGFAEIERNNAGDPIALWILDPTHIEDIKLVRKDGVTALQYLHVDKNQNKTILQGSDVFHIAGLGFDGIRGYSPITKARQAIGTGMAAEEYAGTFFGNGAQPAAVIKHPGHLEPEGRANLKRTWSEAHQGTSNAHKVALLEEGLEIQQYGFSAEDSQLLATRQFTPQQIASLYRLPPPKIGDLSRATFSNIEQLAIWFVTDTIDPWAKRFEMEVNAKLLSPIDRRRFFGFVQLAALLRGDLATRYAAYQTGRMGGWLSVNDIRGFEELDNIGDQGDVYLVPLNMVPADEFTNAIGDDTDPVRAVARGLRFLSSRLANTQDVKQLTVSDADGENHDHCGCTAVSTRKIEHLATDPRLNDVQRRSIAGRNRIARSNKRLFTAAATNSVKREVNAVGRALSKLDAPDGRGAFVDWLDEWYPKHNEHVQRQFAPVIDTMADQLLADVADERGQTTPDDLPPELERFNADYTAGLAKRYVNSSRGQIINLLDEAEAPRARTSTRRYNPSSGHRRRPDRPASQRMVRQTA